MLDAKEMARRLNEVMEARNIRNVDLAHHCGVSQQAVYNWRKDGRIATRHLMPIAEYLNVPVTFFLEDSRGTLRETKATWTKLGFALALVMALLGPYSADDARAFIYSKVSAPVYYVKYIAGLIKRICSYLLSRSPSFAR